MNALYLPKQQQTQPQQEPYHNDMLESRNFHLIHYIIIPTVAVLTSQIMVDSMEQALLSCCHLIQECMQAPRNASTKQSQPAALSITEET